MHTMGTTTLPNVKPLTYSNVCAVCDEMIFRDSPAALTKPLPTCLDCWARSDLPDATTAAAGESAMLKHDQLKAGRRRRQQERWGPFAPLIAALSGTPRWITVWEQGSQGEQKVGRALDAIPDSIALHDRRWPGKDVANLDHILIHRTGVWVIDAKNYRQTKQVRQTAAAEAAARKADRRRLDYASEGVARQVNDVISAFGPLSRDIPVRGIVCLTGKLNRWSWPRQNRHAWVCRPRHLRKIISKDRSIWITDVEQTARLIATICPSH